MRNVNTKHTTTVFQTLQQHQNQQCKQEAVWYCVTMSLGGCDDDDLTDLMESPRNCCYPPRHREWGSEIPNLQYPHPRIETQCLVGMYYYGTVIYYNPHDCDRFIHPTAYELSMVPVPYTHQLPKYNCSKNRVKLFPTIYPTTKL